MATTLVTSVNPTELDTNRSGSEDENRGAETEEESGQQPHTGPAATATHSRLSKLPLARIKALMKTDPDVSLASQESVFIIAKATVPGLATFNIRKMTQHATQLLVQAMGVSHTDSCNALRTSITELFVEMIAKDALVYAQQGKRKTLQRKDLDNAIEAIDEFAFLEGTLD